MEQVLFRTLETVNGKLLGVATLNSAATLNALNLSMVQLLTTQLQLWQQQPQLVAVIIEGSGDKAFCAGGDVRALFNAQQQQPGHYTEQAQQFFAAEYRLDYLLHTFGKPVLVWGNGIVMGGGLGLMMAASHRLVTERSLLAMPEVSIGLYPDVGGSYFLGRLPGKIGLFLGLTAYKLNAADARFCGFANHFLAAADHQRLLDAMCTLSWGDNRSLNHQKLHDLLQLLTANSGEHPGISKLKLHQPLLDGLMAGALADIVPRMQQLQTDEPWLRTARDTMLAGSPLSWALAWEQARLGQTLGLAQCFRMELGWSVNCCAMGDFCEGVRAVLVDKDKSPRWRYGNGRLAPDEAVTALLADPFPSPHPLADLATH